MQLIYRKKYNSKEEIVDNTLTQHCNVILEFKVTLSKNMYLLCINYFIIYMCG